MEKGSLRKGNNKKIAQKHQNSTAYKHNKNSKKTKKILSLPVSGLCLRCKQIIDWRKSYRKYKPLTAPKKCVGCLEKTVKDAYHVLCQNCATDKGVCAKCQLDAEIVEDEKSIEELVDELKKKCLLSSLPEREKRAFIRRLLRDGPEAVSTEKLQDLSKDDSGDDFGDDFGDDLLEDDSDEEYLDE